MKKKYSNDRNEDLQHTHHPKLKDSHCACACADDPYHCQTHHLINHITHSKEEKEYRNTNSNPTSNKQDVNINVGAPDSGFRFPSFWRSTKNESKKKITSVSVNPVLNKERQI